MSLAILLRCDVCDATAEIVVRDDFDLSIMRDANDRSLLIETPWLRWPEGWALAADDDRCPEHAE